MAYTFAVLGGWALVGVLVLSILVAALVESQRLLFVSIGVIEALLLFWVLSLWVLA